MIECVDIFCGLGGLTRGLVDGGIRVVAGVDVDETCRFPYEANNEALFLKRDVRELSSQEVASLFAEDKPRLLAGCAPCQPFSTYSRSGRAERSDDMWTLLEEFGRLVSEVQPEFVTMENVPQLVHHEVFGRFLATFEGYHVSYEIVDCKDFDVPQTRKRLVLLASRYGPIRLARRAELSNPTVRSAISNLPRLAAGEKDAFDELHSACRLSEINLKRIRASKPGGSWRDWPKELIASCHAKDTGATFPSVYGRMEWDEPAPTITTQSFGYGNGRFGHPDQDRAITLREAAVLQTFPADYHFLAPGEKVRFSVLGRLIGNAVPVRLGEAIGRTVIEHARKQLA